MSLKCLNVGCFKVSLFLCSILSGALFAVVWHRYQLAVLKFTRIHLPLNPNAADDRGGQAFLDQRLQLQSYDSWLHEQNLESKSVPREQLSYGRKEWKSSFKSEAQFLKERINVHCMILSGSKFRAQALRDTWTKHCNSAQFYGTFKDKKSPMVHIKMLKHSGDHLFSVRSFCQTWIHMVRTRLSKKSFDWILISSDKTFAIVENLRHMLAPLNQTEPYYMGRPVRHYFLGVYNSYDSGIVLSRGAVELLADGTLSEVCSSMIRHDPKSYNNLSQTSTSSLAIEKFDSFLALELAKFGCRPSNTLDGAGVAGLGRFHPFLPEKHILPELISAFDSFWSTNVLPIKTGFNCCSDKAITFTGFAPVTMYFIEYLIYHLTAFPESELWKGLGNNPPFYQSKRASKLDLDPNLYEPTDYGTQSHSNERKRKPKKKITKKKIKTKPKQQLEIEQMFLDAVIKIRN